jgi:hypothetical protein
MELDHLLLRDIDRKLIELATAGARRVYLAPMDKGLSGSNVWQAQWDLGAGHKSKLHVFKIGPANKLEQEDRAIKDIAAAVGQMSYASLYRLNGADRALLRLGFEGSEDGHVSTISLRNYIRLPKHRSTHQSVVRVISSLYEERMRAWHHLPSTEIKHCSINQAVPKWGRKINLRKVANEIGYKALDDELRLKHNLCIGDLSERVKTLLKVRRALPWGPVHGDLHAANVNLDNDLRVYLIDYGDTRFSWRALDFIILEAAIKFAASPAHAPLNELLTSEELIDAGAASPHLHRDRLYGRGLRKVVAASVAIRKHCRQLGAEPDFRNYRAGLVCVAAAFTSIEWLVNRRFLFHSIAHHCKKL